MAAPTRVAFRLRAPEGVDLPVGLDGWRALDGAVRTQVRVAYGAAAALARAHEHDLFSPITWPQPAHDRCGATPNHLRQRAR